MDDHPEIITGLMTCDVCDGKFSHHECLQCAKRRILRFKHSIGPRRAARNDIVVYIISHCSAFASSTSATAIRQHITLLSLSPTLVLSYLSYWASNESVAVGTGELRPRRSAERCDKYRGNIANRNAGSIIYMRPRHAGRVYRRCRSFCVSNSLPGCHILVYKLSAASRHVSYACH